MINPIPVLVNDSIARAYENGYDLFSLLTDYEIAIDMISYDADFEDYDVNDIQPYIEYQRRNWEKV